MSSGVDRAGSASKLYVEQAASSAQQLVRPTSSWRCWCRFVLQKMANRKNVSKILINSEILCHVQHVLEDLIVVTFSGPNNKLFQGVLLDATKRYCFKMYS